MNCHLLRSMSIFVIVAKRFFHESQTKQKMTWTEGTEKRKAPLKSHELRLFRGSFPMRTVRYVQLVLDF